VPSGYWLTVRNGAKVERARFDTVEAAIEELETRAARLSLGPRRTTVDLKVREFSPAAQVVARLEVSGPGRFLASKRGGVDLRGDGSVQAYVGGARRRLIEPADRQTPYDALREALG
jgi:hypothetical protein